MAVKTGISRCFDKQSFFKDEGLHVSIWFNLKHETAFVKTENRITMLGQVILLEGIRGV